MTVKELIALLSGLEPEALIVIDTGGEYSTVTGAEYNDAILIEGGTAKDRKRAIVELY